MPDFGKILPPTFVNTLLAPFQEGGDNKHLLLGEIADLIPQVVIALMNEWCSRVDKLIRVDTYAHGEHTWRSDELFAVRGCTFAEFQDVFLLQVEDDEYQGYPAYQYFDITTPHDRQRFISDYQNNEEHYVNALKDSEANQVLAFFLDGALPYRLPLDMMEAHTYIVAPTKSGKSSLIQHIVYGLQKKFQRASVIVIDPHGDLSKAIYRSVLNKDHQRVIYCDIDFRKGYTYTINLLDTPDREERTLRFASENIVGVFNEVIDTAFSDVQKNLLQKCINFLLDRGDATMEMFVDLLRLEPGVLAEAQAFDPYFTEGFLKGKVSNTREAVLSRFQYILDNRGMKQLMTGSSTVDLKRYINSGKVILFNLGGLPEDVSRPIFGKMLLAYIKNILMEREDRDLPPAYLVIDECQVFVTGAYEILLSQMRKFGVRMILANQYVSQLGNEKIIESFKQNTAVKIVAGRKVSEVNRIVSVPQRFITQSQNQTNTLDLKQYEFMVDVWYRTPLRVKSPSFLLKSKKYQLSAQEQEALDAYQLSNYYKIIGDDTPRQRRTGQDRSGPPENDASQRGTEGKGSGKKDETKPPFDLFLGADDDDPTTE